MSTMCRWLLLRRNCRCYHQNSIKSIIRSLTRSRKSVPLLFHGVASSEYQSYDHNVWFGISFS
uniref:Uncharacterized protein n=1 Tax=Physcomitrium patens TaxID=3218 RepID=A0A2K1JPF9_PHYPA|nr:hypothetical protein PHYPA_015781 [Physcomitrium patens]